MVLSLPVNPYTPYSRLYTLTRLLLLGLLDGLATGQALLVLVR